MPTLNHFLVFFLLLLAIGGKAQQLEYESPAGTKFLLYIPPGYDAGTSTYPLLLSLHSKGETGDDLAMLTSKNREQMPSRLIYLNRWPQHLPFIVLTPQLKPDPADPEVQWSASYIDEVVSHVLQNYRIDKSRIYVTGISRGGTGAWNYASAYPERVAALLPISGRSDLAGACAIKDIPVWAFHGEDDNVAPASYSVDMVTAIAACAPAGSNKPRLNLLHTRNHNGWNEIYNGTSGYRIYDWMLSFSKTDTQNKGPFVNAGPDLRFHTGTDTLHIAGDFFDWDGEVTRVLWSQTGGASLRLMHTGSPYLMISELTTGQFEFTLTVTDNDGAQTTDKVSLEILDTLSMPSIRELILVDGKTDRPIGSLSDGLVLNRVSMGLTDINIEAIASDGTASIRFSVNTDRNVRTQNPTPYFIKLQSAHPEWEIDNGVYLICATPYAKSYAGGTPGVSRCYKITVTDETDAEDCSATGTIQAEMWAGIAGRDISSIPVHSLPSSIANITIFETTRNIGDNYGIRVRGFLCVPDAGEYKFWIASDDNGELWLSPNEDPARKVRIANVSGWTNPRQWTKYPSQESVPVSLLPGQRYYVEALLKESTGGDHLSVGWQLPNGTQEMPIPGHRLSSYEASGNRIPEVTILNPGEGQNFTSPASIAIEASAADPDGTITRVEFYSGEHKLGERFASPYRFEWDNVSSGSYTISVKATDDAGGSSTATVSFLVHEQAACPESGKIEMEVWSGIAGTKVSAIPLNSYPSFVSDLLIFETPGNMADNYGARIRGYICAPSTGYYTFWISSDDQSELWLGADEDAVKKTKVAYVYGWTQPRQWDKYTTQRSAPIHLVSGMRYYVEALLKEASGADHLSVGWQLPDGKLERPIAGASLIPLAQSAASRVAVMSQSEVLMNVTPPEGELTEISLYPNPLNGTETEIIIEGLASSPRNIVGFVEIRRPTGELLQQDKINIKQENRTVSFLLQNSIARGVYFVHIKINNQTTTRRLLVN